MHTVGRLTTIFVPFGVVALYGNGGVSAVLTAVSGHSWSGAVGLGLRA